MPRIVRLDIYRGVYKRDKIFTLIYHIVLKTTICENQNIKEEMSIRHKSYLELKYLQENEHCFDDEAYNARNGDCNEKKK